LGEFWRIRKKYETQNFKGEEEELSILAIEDYKICFDITQILNVVSVFFSTKIRLCCNLDSCF
jgi:hypothetical protein